MDHSSKCSNSFVCVYLLSIGLQWEWIRFCSHVDTYVCVYDNYKRWLIEIVKLLISIKKKRYYLPCTHFFTMYTLFFLKEENKKRQGFSCVETKPKKALIV